MYNNKWMLKSKYIKDKLRKNSEYNTHTRTKLLGALNSYIGQQSIYPSKIYIEDGPWCNGKIASL